MRLHHLTLPVLLLIIISLTACASRIPRRRTLPAWVNNVYVPMFTNSTSEPGLEEWGTIYAQEEFLADGRLKVSAKSDADLIVAVNIEEYQQEAESFEDDEFPSVSRISTEASVRLYEPSNMEKPIMNLGRVSASHAFISDFRRTDYVPDVDARHYAMRALASRVVNETITGYNIQDEEDIEEEEAFASREVKSPFGIQTARGITISPDIQDPIR